ncbi:MAG: hypothetical protein AAGB29_09615 [Planctomycetota bacterium]
MPTPGLIWRHVTFSTLGTWLPGDPRGFRTRHHKLHSSGDHRNPPPADEHSGLHRWTQQRAASAITFNPTQRQIALDAMTEKTSQHHALAIAVSANHVHALTELPTTPAETRAIVGEWKRIASHALHHDLPGRIWARGCGLKPIADRDHQRRTFHYICRHVDEGAALWRFDQGEK